jgi:hypothetical protein
MPTATAQRAPPAEPLRRRRIVATAPSGNNPICRMTRFFRAHVVGGKKWITPFSAGCSTVVGVLIKWVVCRAVDRDGFDRGQRGWAALAGRPGFLGQCGGWSRSDATLAHVFARWADDDSYRRFMAGFHDELAAAQSGTYASVDARVFRHRRDVGARFDSPGVTVVRVERGPGSPWDESMAGRTVADRRDDDDPTRRGARRGRTGETDTVLLTGWRANPADDLIDLEPAWWA